MDRDRGYLLPDRINQTLHFIWLNMTKWSIVAVATKLRADYSLFSWTFLKQYRLIYTVLISAAHSSSVWKQDNGSYDRFECNIQIPHVKCNRVYSLSC